MDIEASAIIERPLSEVFRFYADEHVRNHPRWSPDLRLQQETPGPIRVGTVIRRSHERPGAPVTGTMRVTEFERDRRMVYDIVEGREHSRGIATFQALGPKRTRITIAWEAPDLEGDEMLAMAKAGMDRSAAEIKRLAEAEPRR